MQAILRGSAARKTAITKSAASAGEVRWSTGGGLKGGGWNGIGGEGGGDEGGASGNAGGAEGCDDGGGYVGGGDGGGSLHLTDACPLH